MVFVLLKKIAQTFHFEDQTRQRIVKMNTALPYFFSGDARYYVMFFVNLQSAN